MWHFIHFVVRPAEGLLGAFCVLTAIALYPNEEGKLQSKFEDFWIRLDDYQQVALSRHSAFMQQVARLESRFLDRVFGSALFSSRVVGVSFSFSLTILSGLVLTHSDFLAGIVSLGFSVLIFVVAVFSTRARPALIAALIALSFLAWAITEGGRDPESQALAFLLVAMLAVMGAAGFACNVAFVVVTRRLLRLASEMTSSLRVATVVIVNLSVAIVLALPFLVEKFPSYTDWNYKTKNLFDSLKYISLTNILDVILAALFVLLAALLLLHRALWPLLTRTLFRMQDIGTKGRRAILTTVGMALLSASIFGGKVPDLFKSFVKIFGG
jgi:hypothetical protein